MNTNEKTTAIKFFWNGYKRNGARTLEKCFYSIHEDDAGNVKSVSICAKDATRLPRDLFDVRNETDLYTDYFDDDSADVTPDHPLFKFVLFAAARAEIRSLKKYIPQLAERVENGREYWPGQMDSLRADLQRRRAELEKLEALQDPGPVTAADLAKIDQARQEAENARRAAEQAEEQARQEKFLRDRANGRRFIAETMEAHKIQQNSRYCVIEWSEDPHFYLYTQGENGEDQPLYLSIAAAEIILKKFDEQRAQENRENDCGGYYKTKFTIHEADGTQIYEGRYDLGDDDGGMIAHIRSFGEFIRDRGQWGNGPTEADKHDGGEIVQLADELQEASDGGRIVKVEFAPWVLEAHRKAQEQAEQDLNDLKNAVKFLTTEEIERAIMEHADPTTEDGRAIGRFFLQELDERDKEIALRVFREWIKKGGAA